MSALDQDRDTPSREGQQFEFPVKAAKKFFVGAIAVLTSAGFAEPATTATGRKAVGRCTKAVDNTNGDDGDVHVQVESGVFRYENSADADEITQAEIGSTCFLVDDQTVAKTNGSSTRSIAGYVVDVDSVGVWVQVGHHPAVAPGGALLAANNLDDVGAAATARANIGANKVALVVDVPNLVGGDATVYRVPSPVAGTIKSIRSVLSDALAAGNATITASIDGVAVTNGVVTITQAGSAAGDKDSATPTAAHAVDAGDTIELTVGGTNTDTDAGASICILIET